MTPGGNADTAVLARGGRTSFAGFLLRLGARMPFLFIAGRIFGAEALGRFAYATMAVELMAQLATLGLKRGLAAELARGDLPENWIVADGLLLALVAAAAGAGLLIALPVVVFPNGGGHGLDRLLPLVALAIVAADVALAALAFRHRLGIGVTARSIVEPWVLALVAGGLGLVGVLHDGLVMAYAASLVAALLVSVVPLLREFGVPRGWSPHPRRLLTLARANIPLAGADAADWGSRRLDIFILGRFADAQAVGIYFVAQQIATLPAKLKTSFDSILGPVVTRALARDDHAGVAAHIRQVGFWIATAQLGASLALGFTGSASLALFGPAFAAGGGVLALLLLVELFGAQASMAEGALIYLRPNINLLFSLAGLVLQSALSLLLVPRFGGVGAAASLAIVALLLALAKVFTLRRQLQAPVLGWRWTLIAAAIPAAAIGYAVLRLPPLWQMVVGIPAILGSFAAIIWTIGYRGADRLLFTKFRG